MAGNGAQRWSDIDPQPPAPEAVVDTEDSRGSRNRHRQQRNTGSRRQPCRPVAGPLRIELPMTGPLREKTHGSAFLEMGQGGTHRAERDHTTLEWDDVEYLEDIIEPSVVPEEVDEAEETDPLAQNRSDQQRIEERVVVGGDDERRVRESPLGIDVESPGHSTQGSDERWETSPRHSLDKRGRFDSGSCHELQVFHYLGRLPPRR